MYTQNKKPRKFVQKQYLCAQSSQATPPVALFKTHSCYMKTYLMHSADTCTHTVAVRQGLHVHGRSLPVLVCVYCSVHVVLPLYGQSHRVTSRAPLHYKNRAIHPHTHSLFLSIYQFLSQCKRPLVSPPFATSHILSLEPPTVSKVHMHVCMFQFTVVYIGVVWYGHLVVVAIVLAGSDITGCLYHFLEVWP